MTPTIFLWHNFPQFTTNYQALYRYPDTQAALLRGDSIAKINLPHSAVYHELLYRLMAWNRQEQLWSVEQKIKIGFMQKGAIISATRHKP